LLPDHVHMLLSIPPKYLVAQIVGFLKGKSAIRIARTFLGHRRNYTGQHFWARGYYVSTVGREERIIREYIRKQEVEGKRLDPMGLWQSPPEGGSHGTALSGSPIRPLKAVPSVYRFERFPDLQASGFAGGYDLFAPGQNEDK
jgi:hypothetical protein